MKYTPIGHCKNEKLTNKQLDNLIEKTYYQHGSGVQISIMDIPKIFADCREKYNQNMNIHMAIEIAIEKYRVKS